MTASCLAALAYLLFGDSRPRVLAAAAAIVAGSLAKQTAVLHVVPLLVVGWVTYGSRRAIEFSVAVAVMGLAAWLLIWAGSEHYFWQATAAVQIMPWSLRQGYAVGYQYLITAGCVTALYAVWLRVTTLEWQVVRDKWCLGFMWALIAASVLSLKAGSNSNYFIDCAWLGGVLIALRAAELRVGWPRLVTAVSAVAAALSLVPVAATLIHTRRSPADGSHRQQMIAAFVKEGVAIADGELTAEVVRAGGSLLVNDPFLFTRLVGQGGHKDQKVIARLSTDAVALLLHPVEWHQEAAAFWPSSVLQVLAADFCLSSANGGVYVYQHSSSEACRRLTPGLRMTPAVPP
jgi:hypothetical protein